MLPCFPRPPLCPALRPAAWLHALEAHGRDLLLGGELGNWRNWSPEQARACSQGGQMPDMQAPVWPPI